MIFLNYPFDSTFFENVNVIIELFILFLILKEGQNRKFTLFLYLIFEEGLIFWDNEKWNKGLIFWDGGSNKV